MFKRILYFSLIAISVSIFSMIDWNGLSSFDPVSNTYATGGGDGGGHHDDDDDDGHGGGNVCPREPGGEVCVCHNIQHNPRTLCFQHGLPSGHKRHVRNGKDTCGPCACDDPGECNAETGVNNLFNNTFAGTACKDATVDVSTFRGTGDAGNNIIQQVLGLNSNLTFQFFNSVEYEGQSFTSNASVPIFLPAVQTGLTLYLDTPVGGTCMATTDSSFTLNGSFVALFDPTTCMASSPASDLGVLAGVESDGTGTFAAGFTGYVDVGMIIDPAIVDVETPTANPLISALIGFFNLTDVAATFDPTDVNATLIDLGAIRLQLLIKQLFMTVNGLFTNILCAADTYFVTGALGMVDSVDSCVINMVDLNSADLIDTCVLPSLPPIDISGGV